MLMNALGSISVSYTHLDVYTRQGLGGDRRLRGLPDDDADTIEKRSAARCAERFFVWVLQQRGEQPQHACDDRPHPGYVVRCV